MGNASPRGSVNFPQKIQKKLIKTSWENLPYLTEKKIREPWFGLVSSPSSNWEALPERKTVDSCCGNLLSADLCHGKGMRARNRRSPCFHGWQKQSAAAAPALRGDVLSDSEPGKPCNIKIGTKSLSRFDNFVAVGRKGFFSHALHHNVSITEECMIRKWSLNSWRKPVILVISFFSNTGWVG